MFLLTFWCHFAAFLLRILRDTRSETCNMPSLSLCFYSLLIIRYPPPLKMTSITCVQAMSNNTCIIHVREQMSYFFILQFLVPTEMTVASEAGVVGKEISRLIILDVINRPEANRTTTHFKL